MPGNSDRIRDPLRSVPQSSSSINDVEISSALLQTADLFALPRERRLPGRDEGETPKHKQVNMVITVRLAACKKLKRRTVSSKSSPVSKHAHSQGLRSCISTVP